MNVVILWLNAGRKRINNNLLVLMITVGCGYGDFRPIEGTDGVLWQGGSDGEIRCVHNVARKYLLSYIVPHGRDILEIDGLKVIVWQVESKQTSLGEVIGLAHCRNSNVCFDDDSLIEVNNTYESLLHEYLEYYYPNWHNYNQMFQVDIFCHRDVFEFWDLNWRYILEERKNCNKGELYE